MKFTIAAGSKTGYLNFLYIIEQTRHRPEVVFTSYKDQSIWEKKIYDLCQVHGIEIKRHININDDKVSEFIKNQNIDIGFLLWWPEILKQESVELTKLGWVNTHPSYLPYNRGKNPYYWSIVDGTPFGVTIHFIDAGIDTGKILFQKEIPISITDTGESLYKKSEIEMVNIFKENFENILKSSYKEKSQDNSLATSHFEKNLVDEIIDLKKTYNALDLINKIRARCFSGRPSNFFFKDGKKYFIRIEIEEAES